jgi:hypothetical protein
MFGKMFDSITIIKQVKDNTKDNTKINRNKIVAVSRYTMYQTDYKISSL